MRQSKLRRRIGELTKQLEWASGEEGGSITDPWEGRGRRSNDLNPFKYAARKLKADGYNKCERDPYDSYLGIIRCLKGFMNTRYGPGRISFEAAYLIARTMLLSKPLSFVTYICVSDYIGGTRFEAQKGEYGLTDGEKQMLVQVSLLSDAVMDFKAQFNWRLILADGWGKNLFGERCIGDSLELYCRFMELKLEKRRLKAIRWSELMSKHEGIYKHACEEVELLADKLAPWESRRGEIGHDKPNNQNALILAKRHIQMRAAEGKVILKEYGPTIVLSTERKKLTRYDNLLVPREDYTHIFAMPFYPHRLP